MSGKPRGRVGKPKQDPDWRAESTEGHLLPQSRVVAAICGHGLKTEPFTNCYSKTKKEKTLEQKLLWLSLFLCSLRPGLCRIQKCPREFESLELASFALVLILCSLHVKTQKCRTHYACCCCCARAKPANESQLKKRNRKRKYRCFLKMYRLSTEITKKKTIGASARSHYQQVSLRSDAGAHKATQIHHQLQQANSTVFTW